MAMLAGMPDGNDHHRWGKVHLYPTHLGSVAIELKHRSMSGMVTYL